MRIRLIAVGNKMPHWINQGYQEYSKRLNQEFNLELIEIAAGKRAKNTDLTRIRDKEAEQMMAAIPPQDYIITLDVPGRSLTTEQLAHRLQQLMQAGTSVSLLIGGPEGLAPICKQRARESWSLSSLTLPHPLVRVVLAEQLYRAWTILKGHPYHR